MSAFSQECREYAWREGVNVTVCILIKTSIRKIGDCNKSTAEIKHELSACMHLIPILAGYIVHLK